MFQRVQIMAHHKKVAYKQKKRYPKMPYKKKKGECYGNF